MSVIDCAAMLEPHWHWDTCTFVSQSRSEGDEFQEYGLKWRGSGFSQVSAPGWQTRGARRLEGLRPGCLRRRRHRDGYRPRIRNRFRQQAQARALPCHPCPPDPATLPASRGAARSIGAPRRRSRRKWRKSRRNSATCTSQPTCPATPWRRAGRTEAEPSRTGMKTSGPGRMPAACW